MIKQRTAVSPSREAAFDILLRVETGAFASNLIASIPDSELSREDRGLAQEIVLGVLRWQKSLDYFVELNTRRPLDKLDLPVLIALRMGLYQLMHLSRVPPAAAVNESVNLVKRARVASAAPMVNAVLRKAARDGEKALEVGNLQDPMERLAVEVSHPKWLLERWVKIFGIDRARALALANNEAPRVEFRVNAIKGRADEVLRRLEDAGCAVRPSDLVPGAYIAQAGGGGTLMMAMKKGSIYIQSEASQLVSLLLEPAPGQSILDLCAAPGSKTTHLAALTGDKCRIVACDLHPQRLKAFNTICKTLGVSPVGALAADVSQALPFIEDFDRFDRVLIDAPCTGTGTLRENPEIKWRLTEADIGRLSDLQFSLLSVGATTVKPGGRLVYSTCSMEPEEGQQVVRRFLTSGAPFRVVSAAKLLEQEAFKPYHINHGSLASAASLVTSEDFVRTFPDTHGTDGFFAAVFERS